MDGLTVIVLVPPPVTWPEVTSIVSTVESSNTFLIVMLPVPAETISEKVMIRLVSTRTSIELSAGESVWRVGGVVSQGPPPPSVSVVKVRSVE